MARLSKEKRRELENKLEEYLKGSRHRIEAFTGLDYYLAGTDNVWNKAYRRISAMPNYELIGICENIEEDEKVNNFESYYDVFNWEK